MEPAPPDLEILIDSPWAATPDDYSSLRYLTFKREGLGESIYGYGQTIYAKIGFRFELRAGSILRLSYLSSPAYGGFGGFEPAPENAEKQIHYTLVRGDYRGVESVVGWPFTCDWLLTLAESPWPAGMKFPHSMPLEFYGYRKRNHPPVAERRGSP